MNSISFSFLSQMLGLQRCASQLILCLLKLVMCMIIPYVVHKYQKSGNTTFFTMLLAFYAKLFPLTNENKQTFSISSSSFVLEKHFIIYISIISIAPTKNNESNNFYFFYKARFPPYVFVIGKVNIKNIFKNSKAYIPNKKLRNIRLWMNRVILFSRLVPFSKTSGYFHVQQCPEKGAVFLKDYNISWFSKWT